MPCTRSLTCLSSKHSFSSSAPIFCQRHGSREQCPQAQGDSRGKPLPEGLLQEHLTGSAVVPHRVPRGRARKEQGATNDPCSTRTCSGVRARLKSAACRCGFFSAPAMGGCWFPSGGFSLNWALQAAMRHGAEAAGLSAAAGTGGSRPVICASSCHAGEEGAVWPLVSSALSDVRHGKVFVELTVCFSSAFCSEMGAREFPC